MQQKLDEICARLEKIENLMVSAPMKEKMQESKEPWYPPEEKFGPWIETNNKPITCASESMRVVQLLRRKDRNTKQYTPHTVLMQKGDVILDSEVVAYRVGYSEVVAYRLGL